jgi:hypothetical protein
MRRIDVYTQDVDQGYRYEKRAASIGILWTRGHAGHRILRCNRYRSLRERSSAYGSHYGGGGLFRLNDLPKLYELRESFEPIFD